MVDPESEWLEASQEMQFPDIISYLERIQVRRHVIEQEDQPDDWEDRGVLLLPEDGGDAFSAVLPKRMVTAFKAILGDRCGVPEVEFLEEFFAWKESHAENFEDYDEEYEEEENE